MQTIASRLRQDDTQISLLEKVHVYQVVSRVWRRFLTPYEFTVITYLVDRSVGWGVDYFCAGHSNILSGNADYAGIGVSQTTYFRCLNSLVAKGMIIRTNRGHSVRIWVNVAWQPPADYSGAWWQPENMAAE